MALKAIAYLLCALACLPAALSAPTKTSARNKPTPSPTILGPQPPHFVVYTDQSAFGIPEASDLEGYNTLILSFLLASGPADQAAAWTRLSDEKRASLKADYKANNITLLVSAFGSTESPTTDKNDPTAVAEQMAAWVKKWGMDGIDVDYEDFEAVGKGQAVAWLSTFTRVLRENLPAGDFVLTHAPVAPWFGKGQPYAQLNETVGDLVDWYNIQFYSQGTAYTTCDTLISSSGGDFPGTSLLEIVDSGIPQHKVVLGKPGTPALVGTPVPSDSNGNGGTQVANGGTQVASGGTQKASSSGSGGTQQAGGFGNDLAVSNGATSEANGNTQEASTGGTEEASSGGTQEASKGTKMASGTQKASGFGKRAKIDPHQNGFLETNSLAQCLTLAKAKGWNAGVMVWEFPDADSQWIKNVRSLTWPVKT